MKKNQELNDHNTDTSSQGHYPTSTRFPSLSDNTDATKQAYLITGDNYNLRDDLLDQILGDSLIGDNLDDDLDDDFGDNNDDDLGSTYKAPMTLQEALSPEPKPASLGPDSAPMNGPTNTSAGEKYIPWTSIGLSREEPLPPKEVVDDL